MRFKEFTHLSCTKAMWMLCALLMSCTGGKTENEDDKDNDTIPADSIGELLLFDKPVVPESVDANFDDFLYTFINDEEFCGQRVQYPLTVVENGKEKVLKQGQWKDADVFKSQELLAFIYNHDKDLLLLKSDSVTDVDLEWIDFEAMSVDLYEFHKEKQWKMIKCTKESYKK